MHKQLVEDRGNKGASQETNKVGGEHGWFNVDAIDVVDQVKLHTKKTSTVIHATTFF